MRNSASHRPTSARSIVMTLATPALLGVLVLSGCESTGTIAGNNSGPSNAEAIANRQNRIKENLDVANTAKESGDYDTALRLFKEILSENPNVTTAYLGLGDIYLDQGDYQSAEPAYGKAAQLEPRNFDAQYGHGLALQYLNRFVEAIRAYHRALVIRPDSPEANLNMATTYLQMNDPRSALAFAEKAVESDPENGPARVNLGAVYDDLGRHDDAIESYRVAMELMDPSPELVLNLVRSLRSAERYREMIDAAETLNRQTPHADAYEAIGYGWFKLRDYDKSMNAYEQAVDLNPDNWPSWNGIGCNAVNKWLLSKKRDSFAKQTAGEALRKSLQLNPNQQNVIQLVSTYRL